jgi:hypothetical protein
MPRRPERTQQNLFTLHFNAPLDTLPVLELLDSQESDDWYIAQIPDDATTVNYWIRDSTVWKMDTLHLSITYLRTDSLLQLQLQTDTVHLAMRQQQTTPQRRSRNDDAPPPVDFLTMTVSASGTINVYDTLTITFPEPVYDLTQAMFLLEIQQDTLWIPAEFAFRQDSVNVFKYYIERPWNYEESYRLTVDSAQIFSIYGKWNNALETTFKIKPANEYGNLFLNILGIEEKAFVELLNGSDVPVRRAKVQDGGALFMNLKPDTYYARLIVDTNENGIWDTGNYAEKLQPEEVYYSPKSYTIRANWDMPDEEWDVFADPLIKQKPMEITKNKPKDVTKQRRDYRQEGQSQQNRSSGMGGMGGVGGLGRGIGL